jgi:hypothetical protein
VLVPGSWASMRSTASSACSAFPPHLSERSHGTIKVSGIISHHEHSSGLAEAFSASLYVWVRSSSFRLWGLVVVLAAHSGLLFKPKVSGGSQSHAGRLVPQRP